MNWKENLPDVGLLLLRVVPSGLMMTHGWPKMNRLIDQWGSEEGVKFFNFLGLGPEVSLVLTVLAELVAPALMVVGWKTRWAALPAAFTMGVAAFVVHGGDPLGDKEMALLYGVAFSAVGLLGGGAWSVDGWLDNRRLASE
ncbi:MAG: DoxX family protein [Bacteroidetes bacterium]|nr:DoxX family protein [Bacteroidota bacterium]MDA0904447.1 DoxX family protein [Bacteroidota bacterium]MDA1242067.1 DoxX family protein [Bacteroidota bacterium]